MEKTLIYFGFMFLTILVQLICLMVKDTYIRKTLFLTVILLAFATIISGLISGSIIVLLWIVIIIIYIINYRQLRD